MSKNLRKNKCKTLKTLLLAGSMASALLFGGCSVTGEPSEIAENEATLVFCYGDNKVSVGEVYIYVRTVKERYEQQYGSDVWVTALPSDETTTVSMADLTREEVVEEIVKVKTLNAHAKDFGIELDPQEQAELLENAKNFYKGLTEEDRETMELDEEKIYQVLCENVIANKVQTELLDNQDIEISDEEARMTSFYDLYFPCFTKDNLGNLTPFTEEEKEEQHQNALQACATLGTAGISKDDESSMEQLAIQYNLKESKQYILSPEEILETYGKDIYEILYSMENGNYSNVIESEYGYHVFQMIFLTDRKATEARKTELAREAIDAYIADTLSAWRTEIDESFFYPASVNMDVYDTISIR